MGLPECATPPEEVYELAKRRGMFAVLEEAIDATETAAQIIEGIVIKNS